MPENADEANAVEAPEDLCDFGDLPEDCAGELVTDPWDLPDEPLEDVLAAYDAANEHGVTAKPEGGE